MERRPNVSWLRTVDTPGLLTPAKPVQPKRRKEPQQFNKRTVSYTWNDCQNKLLMDFRAADIESLRHPRTNCKAKRVVPVIPNVNCSNTIYTIANFGADPADEKRLAKRKQEDTDADEYRPEGVKRLRPSAKDATDRGILRPITNPHDSNDSYLIWFLPDKEGVTRLVQEKANAQDLVKNAENSIGEEVNKMKERYYPCFF